MLDKEGKTLYKVHRFTLVNGEGKIVLSEAPRPHGLSVELHIYPPDETTVHDAIYTYTYCGGYPKTLELDGVTYVCHKQKIKRHHLLQSKVFTWTPSKGTPHMVAVLSGNELAIYPTCSKALEIAIVFATFYACYTDISRAHFWTDGV